MANNKKPYALRVDETAFEKLKIISALNHRSINSQIESLIEQCISNHEKKYGEIQVDITK